MSYFRLSLSFLPQNFLPHMPYWILWRKLPKNVIFIVNIPSKSAPDHYLGKTVSSSSHPLSTHFHNYNFLDFSPHFCYRKSNGCDISRPLTISEPTATQLPRSKFASRFLQDVAFEGSIIRAHFVKSLSAGRKYKCVAV